VAYRARRARSSGIAFHRVASGEKAFGCLQGQGCGLAAYLVFRVPVKRDRHPQCRIPQDRPCSAGGAEGWEVMGRIAYSEAARTKETILRLKEMAAID